MNENAGAKTLPRHVELLRQFVNTRNIDAGTDTLGNAPGLADWFREHESLAQDAGIRSFDRPGRVTGADAALARRLREGLREVLIGHHDGIDRAPGAEQVAPLDEIAAGLGLRMTFDSGAPALVPTEDGVRGALAGILVAIDEAKADGSWQRLKVCDEDSCRWAFYDASRNHSRQWCTMRTCGNRSKTRTYRAKRRDSQ